MLPPVAFVLALSSARTSLLGLLQGSAHRRTLCLEWYSTIGNGCKQYTEHFPNHVVSEDYPGLVTITGGKWTTYRSMAEEALDTAIKSGKLNPTSKCLTYDIQLIGADGWEPASFTVLAQQYMRMKRTYSGKVVPGVMGTAAAKHLSHAYGTLAERVAAIAQNENLGKRLAHGYPFLEAEVAYCARNEHCESAVDFIARRSRLAFLDTDAANRALPRVIEILATEHNWDKSRPKQELKKAKEFLEPSSHLKMLNSTMGNTRSMELLM